LPEVDATCNRVAIINRGQLIAAGTLDTLMHQLTGALNYEVEVRGTSADIQQTLLNIPAISTVEQLNSPGQDDSRYRFQVTPEAAGDPGEAIAATLVQAGFGLCELRRHQASLEDIFLNLTMEETAAEAEEVEVGEFDEVESNG
ncbi:MAG: ABC transporter ATP-binding protein, partial [Cyanobacteria bacterium J06559_3]